MQKLDHRFGDDGSFWMSYEDLLKKYQTFDRTRLFTDEWKVTQQWTSLEVPWTVNYHDTKFSFTLDKPAPVMIVLSQVIYT
jgi:C1A family cysteine protease